MPASGNLPQRLLRLASSGHQPQKTAGSAAVPSTYYPASAAASLWTGHPVSHDPEENGLLQKADLSADAAAALYGSSAANGVVIITTKKGKEGRASISFNTSTTFDIAAYGIPEFQNHYTGVSTSWGSDIKGSPDYTDDFFKTGVTTINSLSLSMGSQAMQTYFSYANTYGIGRGFRQGVLHQG